MTVPIQRILTRYTPQFIMSLIYMLQASEYEPERYLAWVRRTTDFRAVQHRKRLRYTPKAVALLAASWTIVVAWVIVMLNTECVTSLLNTRCSTFLRVLIAGLGIAALPLALPRAVLAALFLVHVVQWPIERWLIARAKRRLRDVRAIKIAIAGSFGKTTMKEILRTVLAEGKTVAATPGNANTPIGISRFVQTLQGDEQVLIFEFGEYYPGDIAALCALVEPDIGIITGVNEAHLERFGTLERTTKTIFELVDYLGKKPLYINGESVLFMRSSGHPHDRLYSRHGIADWKVSGETTGIDGTKFTLTRDTDGRELRNCKTSDVPRAKLLEQTQRLGTHHETSAHGLDSRTSDVSARNVVIRGQKIEASSGLIGLHQIGPLAAAAAIAFELGLSAAEIERGISNTQPFEHRLAPRREESGVVTIDDTYNGNPDGARAAIEFLRSVDARRRIYVTPGFVEMGERANAVHEKLGRELAGAVDMVVLVRNSATPHIARGLSAAGFRGQIVWYDDALMMYAALPMLALPGDVVLLQNDWPDGYE